MADNHYSFVASASTSSSQFDMNTTGTTSASEQKTDAAKDEQPNLAIIRSPPAVGTPEERRGVSMYCVLLMPRLVSENIPMNKFWQVFVPQVSQSEAAIRHMLVACSSYAETVSESSNNPEASLLVSRRHHARALRALTNLDTQPSVTIMLTACILLIVRESSGNGETSDTWILHTLAGLQILREWKLSREDKKGYESDLILTVIEPYFLHLEMIMTMFWPALLRIVPQPGQERPRLPESFTNHRPMQDTFHEIYRWRYHDATEKAKDWTASSRLFSDVNSLLQEWHRLVLLYQSQTPQNSLERLQVASISSLYNLAYAAFLFSVRTNVPTLQQYCPLVVDLSQPRSSVVIRDSIIPSSGETHEGCRIKQIQSINPSSGLWFIREMWRSGPRNVVTVMVDASEYEKYLSSGHQANHTVPQPTTPEPGKSTGSDSTENQQRLEDHFEFIDVTDPLGRTRARSHLTRQQQRAMRKEGATKAKYKDRTGTRKLTIAPKKATTS